MGAALLQTKTGTSTGGVSTTTATLNTTALSSLVVVTAFDDSGTNGVITGITCTGMTFAKIDENHDTGGTHGSFWYSYNTSSVATNPTLTVTNNQGGGLSSVGIIVREYIGPTPYDPLDKHIVAIGGSSGTPSSGATAALVGADDLVIGWGGTLDSGNTYTAGTGYANATTLKVGTTLDMGMEDKKLIGITTAQTATFTITNSSFWTCGVATFKTSSSVSGANYESPRHVIVGTGMSRGDTAF